MITHPLQTATHMPRATRPCCRPAKWRYCTVCCLTDLHTNTSCQYFQMSPSLLQASSIEVLQSLLEANERFRGKVQQQHYAAEMLQVSRWLPSWMPVLAHHSFTCVSLSACVPCTCVP